MHTFIVWRAFARVSISLSVLVVVLCAGATRVAAGAAPNGVVKIMNAHSGLCLSPAGGGRDKNVEIVQFTCDTDQSRSWNMTALGGDLYQIINVNSGLCLTVAGGSTERNVVSVQYLCDTDPSRRWRYMEIEGGMFRLVNVHSGLCLTVAGGGTDRNGRAVQFPCDGDPSRNWKVIPGR
jgi:Ricin-type beta-trefoil lectin domain.